MYVIPTMFVLSGWKFRAGFRCSKRHGLAWIFVGKSYVFESALCVGEYQFQVPRQTGPGGRSGAQVRGSQEEREPEIQVEEREPKGTGRAERRPGTAQHSTAHAQHGTAWAHARTHSMVRTAHTSAAPPAAGQSMTQIKASAARGAAGQP